MVLTSSPLGVELTLVENLVELQTHSNDPVPEVPDTSLLGSQLPKAIIDMAFDS